MKYKRSKQRDRIYELLKSTGIHPTADWIYERLKPEFPNLSMGTVYRNLNILVEQGKLRKLPFGSTFDRFDAKIEPHYHFICIRCGAIIDLSIPVERNIEKKVEINTKLKVLDHSIEFYGLCEVCRSKIDEWQKSVV